jgi:formylglycine-generating enzyme required for sulfatase activity
MILTKLWDNMTKFQSLLLLLAILGVTIACASASDSSLGSVPSRTAAGDTIPTFVRGEFVDIAGSEAIVGQLKANVSFSTQADITYTTEIVSINTFKILRSEVTIQMYVEFLNSEPFVGSTSSSEGSATSGSGQEDRSEHFKSGMSNDFLGGIFRTDSSGGLVLGNADELGSGTIESTTGADDTFRIKAEGFSDPFKVLEKPRQESHTGGEGELKITYNITPGRATYPIAFVTKDSALAFAAWLGSQYRLPTGEEWEFAARGGEAPEKIIDFPIPDDTLSRVPAEVVAASTGDPEIENFLFNMHLHANFQGEFNESPGPAPVKSYRSNGYGVYDMMGNLFEWTASSPFETVEGFSTSTVTSTSFLRGGSWASRNFHSLSVWGKIIAASPDNFFGDTGFRIIFQKATVFTAEQLAQE